MKIAIYIVLLSISSTIAIAQQKTTLTKEVSEAILYMREEEKLARDVYEFLYVKYNVNPFGNIRLSEQTHMDRMKTLISTYGLTDPVERNADKPGTFVNPIMQNYYTELSTAGSQSLSEALKVGAKIEELDIKDLEDRKKLCTQTDIIGVFDFLIMASENHLRAFVRRLKMQGITYEPSILSKETFDTIIASENKHMGGRP